MSAPEPATVKVPLENVAVPGAPTLPTSWSVHGLGKPVPLELMLNVCGTLGAGLKFALPDCDAVIVQLPAPVIVTVFPDTVQFPVAPRPTARPDDTVAVTAKGGSPVVL